MFAAIRRVFHRDPHANLKVLLGDMPLPSFPASTRAVLQSLRTPDTPLSRIGEQIAADPGLSVDVLRVVNSAAYGLRRPVSDAAHAARLLGHADLENMVLSVAVRKTLPAGAVPGFSPGIFWRNAARRAATAKVFADAVSPATARQVFTGALLQDMAVPLLAHANPDDYRATLEAGTRKGDLDTRERKIHGWDHAQVAGWLCESWALPDTLMNTITSHHSDDAPVAIHIAVCLPELEGGDIEPAVEAARKQAHLAPEATMQLLQHARVLADELGSLFS